MSLEYLIPLESKSSVYILDSSFDPPHISHLTMIKNTNGLLLLSTKNMDKHQDNINDRILLVKSLGLPFAITDQGRFIDKAKLIQGTWVMGYDTLIRFFNKKYYSDFENDMESFFKSNRIKCFDRGNIGTPIWERVDLQHVLKYKDYIDLEECLPDEACISSSEIREMIGQKDQRWKKYVPTAIQQLIVSNKMYGYQ
ncbi:hypothetical protein HDV06_005569 [Boothiomyces sp. JEL0866]|nr:hypothetical protein HDV06_005569 [Boothiomyces sp. JEL0866]